MTDAFPRIGDHLHAEGVSLDRIVHDVGTPVFVYSTMALCEASYDTRDKNTLVAAQSAVRFILYTQNKDGGWPSRIRPKDDEPDPSNLNVTTWTVAALRSAELAGIPVPLRISSNFFSIWVH